MRSFLNVCMYVCGAEGESEEVFFGLDGGVSTRKSSSSSFSALKKRKRSSKADAAAATTDGPAVSTVSSMEAAESLIELSLGQGSTDNISAVVVKFPKLIRSKL